MKKLKFILLNPIWSAKMFLVKYLSFFKFIYQTRHYQCSINFDFWFIQKILNFFKPKNMLKEEEEIARMNEGK